tara:strand:- start:20835 stop:20936 length:102 start_codon:yes stop_codon:yes gene_type:complete
MFMGVTNTDNNVIKKAIYLRILTSFASKLMAVA